jgi:transposase
MNHTIAAIDVHKKVLMVVVLTACEQSLLKATGEEVPVQELQYQSRRFAATARDRRQLVAWLRERGVREVVMESTAQYWKPVWLDLEPHFAKLHLAQAQSNRAPKGRKHDFRDAERLGRRLLAGELVLSFVPEAEQRDWRTVTRGKQQLVRDRVRLQNQLEALLEEARIKLSSVVSDLLGLSGRRILLALSQGNTDPASLAELGDQRLQCSLEELTDALTGAPTPLQLELLKLYLKRLDLLDSQILQLDLLAAKALKPYQDAVGRLAQVPGLGVDSAQQAIAEVGVDAKTFPSADAFASWVGTIPGTEESAEQNHSSRSPKGNRFLRRLFTQAAQAAVKMKGCWLQSLFRRLAPRLGYKGAIWAVANRISRLVWKILHDGVCYVERGSEPDSKTKRRRTQRLTQALRTLGYSVTLTPIKTEPLLQP